MFGSVLAQTASDSFFAHEDVYIPTLIAASLVVVFVVRTIGSVLKTSSRERTRREIAAYIAEGSMTPEQGERLMKAGRDA